MVRSSLILILILSIHASLVVADDDQAEPSTSDSPSFSLPASRAPSQDAADEAAKEASDAAFGGHRDADSDADSDADAASSVIAAPTNLMSVQVEAVAPAVVTPQPAPPGSQAVSSNDQPKKDPRKNNPAGASGSSGSC